MGNHCISEDVKQIALKLWNQGWEAEDICDILDISCASLYRWQAIFEEHGSVIHPPSLLKGQRTHILTHALIQACQDLFSRESDLYLNEVVAWLALEHDIVISISTLARNLTEVGLTHKILHKLASERDEQRPQDFRQLILHTFQGDGSEFIFVDETSKDEHTWARHYGRAMSGAHASLSDVFVCGDRYSLVAAMTIDGYIAADVVEGLYDHELFYAFITQQVVCYLQFAALSLTHSSW